MILGRANLHTSAGNSCSGGYIAHRIALLAARDVTLGDMPHKIGIWVE